MAVRGPIAAALWVALVAVLMLAPVIAHSQTQQGVVAGPAAAAAGVAAASSAKPGSSEGSSPAATKPSESSAPPSEMSEMSGEESSAAPGTDDTVDDKAMEQAPQTDPSPAVDLPANPAEDAVSRIIDNVMAGQALNLNGIAGNSGDVVAMGNKNAIKNMGVPGISAAPEQEVKKVAEAGTKAAAEQATKLMEEERAKKIATQLDKVRVEQKMKQYDEDLRTKTEQNLKLGQEQQTKSAEQTQKDVESTRRDRRAQQVKERRTADVMGQLHRSYEARADQRAELDRRVAMEKITKKTVEQENKISQKQRRLAAEGVTKENAEEDFKESIKRNQDRAREHQAKADKHQDELNAKKVAEEARKFAEAKWCNCKLTPVPFGQNERWHTCDGNRLLVGIRRTSVDNLSGIDALECCEMCGPDDKVVGLKDCENTNWVHSFDVQGWSKCPENKYLRGFFKSSCNHIYCLEHAQCCGVSNSQGKVGCKVADWAVSFDTAGLSKASSNHFLTGLWRSSSHNLHNIEHAEECEVYSR